MRWTGRPETTQGACHCHEASEGFACLTVEGGGKTQFDEGAGDASPRSSSASLYPTCTHRQLMRTLTHALYGDVPMAFRAAMRTR